MLEELKEFWSQSSRYFCMEHPNKTLDLHYYKVFTNLFKIVNCSRVFTIDNNNNDLITTER